MGFTAIAAIAAVAGTAYQIEQGEDAQRAQRRAQRNQEAVQRQQLAEKLRVERQNREAINRANSQQPDLGAIMGDAEALGRDARGTLLAGTFGADPAGLLLRPKLLGE